MCCVAPTLHHTCLAYIEMYIIEIAQNGFYYTLGRGAFRDTGRRILSNSRIIKAKTTHNLSSGTEQTSGVLNNNKGPTTKSSNLADRSASTATYIL